MDSSDVASYYHLDRLGIYNVKMHQFVYNFYDDGTQKSASMPLDCGTVDIELTTEKEDPKYKIYESLGITYDSLTQPMIFNQWGTPSFDDCSSARVDLLTDAYHKATGSIHPDITDNYVGSPSYVKWFGSLNSSRENTVKNSLNDMWNNKSEVTLDCDAPYCDGKNINAFVNAILFKRIYICNPFWTLPEEGRDSQMGVIAHEMSHSFPKTEDHVYGVSDCRNLAQTNPGKAIENADSYQLFVEDIHMGRTAALLVNL